jgi:hypothetical protein
LRPFFRATRRRRIRLGAVVLGTRPIGSRGSIS